MNLCLIVVLIVSKWHWCRIDVPARRKGKKFYSIFTRFSTISQHAGYQKVICIQINVPPPISNNTCFREKLNSFFPFWTDGFFAVAWSHPVRAECDLQRQVRTIHRGSCLSFLHTELLRLLKLKPCCLRWLDFLARRQRESVWDTGGC